ncbi:hypothetical protein DFJ58DRAFT_734107 [Suillus subalutaceus]|uniref:uncharacterized protein n=1 Tax=Suillus subalutaceus TaxID=48586 RepID=UPI001B877953|nr:uncharacterized protein DFJ58DRAFT_734107 [Suillus subalutaceus]KAG1837919.1 hypothetical protein DFJ58DRAFT_734107 [Suillus subalutaceus]
MSLRSIFCYRLAITTPFGLGDSAPDTRPVQSPRSSCTTTLRAPDSPDAAVGAEFKANGTNYNYHLIVPREPRRLHIFACMIEQFARTYPYRKPSCQSFLPLWHPAQSSAGQAEINPMGTSTYSRLAGLVGRAFIQSGFVSASLAPLAAVCTTNLIPFTDSRHLWFTLPLEPGLVPLAFLLTPPSYLPAPMERARTAKGNSRQTSMAGGCGSIYRGSTTTRRRTADYELGLLLLRQDPWHSRPDLSCQNAALHRIGTPLPRVPHPSPQLQNPTRSPL